MISTVRKMNKPRSETKEDLVFLGPGITNQEMDAEFKRLYDSLIAYKDNIFHLVDTICTDCEERDRLALNIAERDSSLVQRLVAKECDRRNMMRATKRKSVLDELRNERTPEITVTKILQTRSIVLNESAKAEGGD